MSAFHPHRLAHHSEPRTPDSGTRPGTIIRFTLDMLRGCHLLETILIVISDNYVDQAHDYPSISILHLRNIKFGVRHATRGTSTPYISRRLVFSHGQILGPGGGHTGSWLRASEYRVGVLRCTVYPCGARPIGECAMDALRVPDAVQ